MKALWISAAILLWLDSGCLSSSVPRPPPLYSLQSVEDPDKFHIFFSTMDYFRHIGIVRIAYFLTSSIAPEYFGRVNLSEATCIRNSSYCYITANLPKFPGACEFLVTLRGNLFENSDVCEFSVCPNMNTQVGCQLTVVDRLNCPDAMSKPYNNCRLPPELIDFLPPPPPMNITTVTTTEMDSTIGAPNSANILIVSFVLVMCCAATVALSAYLILRRQRRNFVVLVSLSDLDSLLPGHVLGRADNSMAVKLPRLPGRKDGAKVAKMPEYSLQLLLAPHGIKNAHHGNGMNGGVYHD